MQASVVSTSDDSNKIKINFAPQIGKVPKQVTAKNQASRPVQVQARQQVQPNLPSSAASFKLPVNTVSIVTTESHPDVAAITSQIKNEDQIRLAMLTVQQQP